MPRLKPRRAVASPSGGRSIGPRALAKPRPWIRPKAKATCQRRAGQERPEIVERGQDDGGGDGALDQARRQVDHAEDGQGQAEAVGEGERGEDLRQLAAPAPAGPGARAGTPPAAGPPGGTGGGRSRRRCARSRGRGRRQEAGSAPARPASMTVSGASGDSTAEVTAPPGVDRQQAAMGRVAVEQEAVAQAQRPGARAVGDEAERPRRRRRCGGRSGAR